MTRHADSPAKPGPDDPFGQLVRRERPRAFDEEVRTEMVPVKVGAVLSTVNIAIAAGGVVAGSGAPTRR